MFFRLAKYGRKIGMAVIIAAVGINTYSQVFINEFSASNSALIADPEYNNYSDWVEVYNAGSLSVNLKGYFITDNFNQPEKWPILTDANIPPGGYFLIWSDDMATGFHTNFKLAAEGEEIALYNSSGILIDSVSYSQQKTDISFGRRTDGSQDWGYFLQPTPAASNSTISFTDITYNLPEFSLRGGIYNSTQLLELTNAFGGDIRFTTDGSEPVLSSSLYTSAITIGSTTILRARIFKPGEIPGPTVTNSYFINENSVGGLLPVVSIATAPGNFWDSQDGIYVQNFKPSWEIPINIELFENNGSDRAAFSQLAGTKVNGLYSWKLPQKMLGIYFRNSYDAGNLDYPIVHQRKRRSFKSFALRASGSDWSYTLFRDVLGQHSTLYNMDIDIMGFRPSILYVNGEYMGIHNIREKVDDDYIEKSHNMEPGTFDLVENEDFAEAGDLEAYNYLLGLLGEDLSVEENYNAVAELVDIKNFTDYVITEMAVANTSIDHNVMAWKPKGYGKWKWVLMDVDRGFFDIGGHLINFYTGRDQLLLEELIANQGYKEYFARRLAAQLYTSFNPTRMKQLIDEHAGAIAAEIPRHIERWQGTTSSYGDAIPSVEYWNEEVCKLKSFVEARPAALLSNLQLYGFSSTANLSLSAYPAGAGKIKLDSLKVPGLFCFGPYLKDVNIQLIAESNPGFEFQGWRESVPGIIIPKSDLWRYLDNGNYPGSDWITAAYNDNSWSEGNAQFGYGDGDEETEISFGGNSQNKFITSWFRKKFNVSEEEKSGGQFILKLLRDDGAIVYLNGDEIIRSNMSCGAVDYLTAAASSVDGEAEKIYISYPVDPELFLTGENILAVEIHQRAANSSDASFDLELTAYMPDKTSFISTSEILNFSLEDDRFLTAEFSKTSDCVLPELITEDLTIGTECSPWLVSGDIYINENATLTIEPGVEIRMPEGASIFVAGEINAEGTADQEIVIKAADKDRIIGWGGIVFQNTERTSHLSYMKFEDANGGPDPVTENAAISAFKADLVMDHLIIEKNHGNPIMARYSDITLTNSRLHSEITGDLINVKYGKARIENCSFVGNNQPDTDAIDYDEIENGIIRNCVISEMLGFNSDAIDIGEKATGILIDSIRVFNITDKGVSLGQQSTATIQNCVFLNCNMGIAVKDSSRASINHCVFYNNVYPVASYEKNAGHAGGNPVVENSILSNSSGSSVFVDSKSTLKIRYSLSDNNPLPGENSNILANPLFKNPAYFDFEFNPGSPVLDAGYENGHAVDMGIPYNISDFIPDVMINEIFVDPVNQGFPEFISLYNPSEVERDMSGYSITKGVTASIPVGTVLGPRDVLYLTNDAQNSNWSNQSKQVFQWETGTLSNNGEAIQLEESHGIVVDYLYYKNDGLWPAGGFDQNGMFHLIDPGLDNHFPGSWITQSVSQIIDTTSTFNLNSIDIYPNPTVGLITIQASDFKNQYADIYSFTGKMLGQIQLDERGHAYVDLSVYNSGLLIIKVGEYTRKIVLLK